MKDAIGVNTCKTCRFFHQPNDGQVGVCIKRPPTPFIVGMTQSSPPVIAPDRPPQVQPVVHAFFPVVSVRDGCAEHVSVHDPDLKRSH